MGTYSTGKAQKGNQTGASEGRGREVEDEASAQQGPWISFRVQRDPRGGFCKGMA